MSDEPGTRSGLSCLGGLAVVALVLAVAVGGVVAILTYVVRSPASGTCRAEAGGDLSATLDGDQAANAALMVGLAQQRDLPIRATTVAISTAMQESKLRNIDYGDRDSVGLFQQRESQGWGSVEEIMDPVYSTGRFYDELVTIDGWEEMSINDAAQAVQRSGYPEAYAQHEPMARAFAANLVGQVEGGLTCRLSMPDDAENATDSLATATVTDLALRDLGLTPEERDAGVLVLDSAGLPDGAASDDSGAAAGWGVAHWGVATATETDALAVATDGRVWLRSEGDDAGWTALDEVGSGLSPVEQSVVDAAAGLEPGQVAIG
ncbi:hypothetical protein ACPYO6_15300 [Georgenia sp. Z1344]|uniref:hypothetical protein n=1 Tax=Georgenia sp. Z1344 TaxID=3416706 RepID=UPI003CEDF8A9